MKRLLDTDASWVSLLQRLVLAIVIFPHGAQKLLGWWGGGGFAGTIESFGQQGIPAALAVLVILAESLGSVALALGLLSRLAALGIACVMVGATVLVHADVGFFMNWTGQQEGEGFEYHLLALALAIPLIIKGGGLYSLDRAIAHGAGRPTTRPHTMASPR
ncbi:MAG TPA: DoxX family protein [Kofleriaceae bacterium]|nr:DoxX family protein [Kofleriaceae bacterium]